MPTEYDVKLSGRVKADVLTRILCLIGEAGAAIDFLKALPVTTPPVLVADPSERLVPDELPASLEIDHQEIKRLAKKLAANQPA